MEQLFFVSFEDSTRCTELSCDLTNTIRRMNQVNHNFESEGTRDVAKFTPARFHKHEGYFVSGWSNVSKDSCWDILMHKYISLSNDKKSGVFFFQEEYSRMKCQQMKLAVIETA